MEEIYKLFVGSLIVIAGFPIGKVLAKKTKDELKDGQKWFKLIVILSLVAGIIGLVIRRDVLFFTTFFFASVASGSLKKRNRTRS
jgi:hypothetical protein